MTTVEKLLQALLAGNTVDIAPRSDFEQYLLNILEARGTTGLPSPNSTMETYLYALAEKVASGDIGGGDDARETETYVLLTPSGEEIPAVLVEEATAFTATANDIREGMTAVTDDGVTTGTKVIPSYNTYEGYRLVPVGSRYVIPHMYYDYTRLQAIFCPFNASFEDSVAAERVALEDNVYAALSTDSISIVEKDEINSRVDFGLTNDSDKPYLIRYFMYKEVY